jgi:hypothetical protein
MSENRSANDPISLFALSLKERMTNLDVTPATLSAATSIPLDRLQEILDSPGTVRLAEIATLAIYFQVSLTSFFF